MLVIFILLGLSYWLDWNWWSVALLIVTLFTKLLVNKVNATADSRQTFMYGFMVLVYMLDPRRYIYD
jgi:hypothetical protein